MDRATSRRPPPRPSRSPLSGNPDSSHGHALEFLRLIWALDHALQVRSKHMARVLRVTGPQRLALRMIETAPGLTARELTGLLYVHKSTLSGILQRLEAAGLIVRDTDPGDARRQRLSVTPGGRGLVERRAGTVEATVSDVLREFSAREVEIARRVLDRMTSRLLRLPHITPVG